MPPLFLARFGLLAALLLTMSAAACSSSEAKKVDADDWVADLCDIAIDFQEAGDEAGEDFLEADLEDTKEAKEAFAKSVSAQKDAQKDFRADFEKIGEPDVEDGDKIVEAFEQQFDDNDDFTGNIADAVADIDDDDDFFEEFLAALDDNTEPDFRETLEDVAGDGDGVEDVVRQIEDDEECASVIFDDEEVGPGNDPTAPATQSARPTTTSRTPAAGGNANQQWVRGVCTSYSGWVKDIQNANTEFQSKVGAAAANPASLKKLMVDSLKIAQAETKNLQREMNALSAPTGDRAEALYMTFAATVSKLVALMDALVAEAEKPSTASEAELAADAESIGEMFAEISSGFEELPQMNAPELKAIFDAEPACAGF